MLEPLYQLAFKDGFQVKQESHGIIILLKKWLLVHSDYPITMVSI